VTGASVGLGRASALMLAREGGRLVLTDLKEAEGQGLADQIINQGGEAIFVRHDVANEAEWIEAVRLAVQRFGRVDVLVNNAGVALAGGVEDTSLEQWRWLMGVNLDGVFLGTKHILPAMRPHGGSIINLSSIEGLVGDPNLAAYNAAKGGVRLLTKSTALDFAKRGYGIRVNSIHPGYIRTPMVEGYAATGPDAEAGMKALAALHPLGRIGEPDDIAYGVVYLASEESRFVTGSELVIDGGYTAQ
jgi:NAD(P)-dependent dehydrogenase (short-subunit alcohol dehydrogenase family)